MSDENISDVIQGQASEAPGGQESEPQTETRVTQPEQAQSTQATAEEQFFADYNSLPDDIKKQIEPYYKQMQADYTRKTQKLSKAQRDHIQKVQAYDQFMSNPLDNIMRMATQYGLQFTPAGQPQQQAAQQPQVTPDWTPNTWEEVFGKSAEYLKPKFQEMLQEAITPYQQEIAGLKAELGTQRAGRIEAQFNQIDPNWRQYEDEMRELLDEHPSLAKDPIKLYRLAVPDDVFKARATQEAIKTLEAKTKAAKIESSGRSQPSGPVKKGPMSFQEAFEAAKNSLGRK